MALDSSEAEPRHVYIFLDESGNMDFSGRGTKYFTMTSVSKIRPFVIAPLLDNLKYDLIEIGLDLEYFHAAEDQQHVRNRVFDLIEQNLGCLQIDTLVVEKARISPLLRDDLAFYPTMLGALLRVVLQDRLVGQFDLREASEVLVITDSLPIQRKRRAVEKAVKTTLKSLLPPECRYRIMHHASKSIFGLQIADYCNWAIFRKYEREDVRAYERIARAIHRLWDIGLSEDFHMK